MTARRQETYRLTLPGGGAVQAYLSEAESAGDFAVVYVHGFGATRQGEKAQALEQVCQRRGWTYASFDFRGHGESTGTMLELRDSGLLQDIEALQQDLASKGIRRVFPVGSSMGGWAAAWFSVRHPNAVPACAVIAPALDFVRHRWVRLTGHERNAWKQTGRHRVQIEWVDTEIGYGLVEEIDQFPVEGLAAKWSTPLLVFHGLQDDTILYTYSLDFIIQTPYLDIELRDRETITWSKLLVMRNDRVVPLSMKLGGS